MLILKKTYLEAFASELFIYIYTINVFEFCSIFPVSHSDYSSSWQMTDKLLETENEAMSKLVELEKQLMQKNKELDTVRVSITPPDLEPRACSHKIS